MGRDSEWKTYQPLSSVGPIYQKIVIAHVWECTHLSECCIVWLRVIPCSGIVLLSKTLIYPRRKGPCLDLKQILASVYLSASIKGCPLFAKQLIISYKGKSTHSAIPYDLQVCKWLDTYHGREVQSLVSAVEVPVVQLLSCCSGPILKLRSRPAVQVPSGS